MDRTNKKRVPAKMPETRSVLGGPHRDRTCDPLIKSYPVFFALLKSLRYFLCFSTIWTGSYILALLLLLSCGGGSDPAPGPHIAEQTDYFDGVTYHRFYRYTGALLGYASSLDGIHFEPYRGNPIMEDSHFPYLVEHKGGRYLIVQHRTGGTAFYLYDVNVPTAPRVLNSGRPVLEGGFFNVGVAVVGDRWHMLVEGKSGEMFHLRYTWADFPDLDFNANLGSVIINDAGNPYLAYIPDRNAILALYGGDYSGTGTWRVRAAAMPLGGTWQDKGVFLQKAGVHIADPDLGIGAESSPLIITVGHAQNAVSTYLFSGSKLDLYDAIMTGHWELEEIGVTMEAE